MFEIKKYYGNVESYTLLDQRKTLIDFKRSVAQVFAYIKKIIPRAELKVAGRYLLQYQCELYNLIYSIIHKSKTTKYLKSPNAFLMTSYDDLMTALDISYRFEPTDIQFSKDVWGPIYWDFLHLTSIMCNDDHYKRMFACIMMNFNLVIMCSTCAFNFRDKNPFMLTMIILLTKDAITNMYNFHNIVNKALKKPPFEYSEFLLKYNLKPTNNTIIEKEYHFVTLDTDNDA